MQDRALKVIEQDQTLAIDTSNHVFFFFLFSITPDKFGGKLLEVIYCESHQR
jgi:hypothetical protein